MFGECASTLVCSLKRCDEKNTTGSNHRVLFGDGATPERNSKGEDSSRRGQRRSIIGRHLQKDDEKAGNQGEKICEGCRALVTTRRLLLSRRWKGTTQSNATQCHLNNSCQSLFVGFDAQLMRDGPFYAFFFGSYELNCYLFRTYVPSMPEELNYFLR